MSEIKGQLLGVILVLSIFGIVSAGMISAFTTLTNKVGKKIDEVDVNQPTTKETTNQIVIDSQLLANKELLVF